MPFGGQTPPVQLGARDLHARRRGTARVEIGPEPGDEEHHLGGDEQDHAVALMQIYTTRV